MIVERMDGMKRGYYIHFEGRTSVGISKKIDMQLEEFGRYFEMKELEVETIKRNILQRIIGLLPMMSIKRNYEDAFAQLDEPDFIYIRRTVADRAYVKFWEKVKKKYPNCKIVIEIFTYPYDKDDFGKWNAWPFYIKELIYRPRLKKYVDRFVTYSDDRVIFGIPTIIATNGVIVDKIKKVSGEFREGKLTLIGVAYMQRQHGYERIIEGLRKYYAGDAKTDEVQLMLVGDGPEKAKYQKLVEKYHLQEYVTFYPVTVGDELDHLYDQADIALMSFGMYKLNYYGHMGIIKSKECLAKGMLMITGNPIDVLEEDFPYVKNFSNDSSAVDIGEVVRFFEGIRQSGVSKTKLAERIHEYAKTHADMQVVMKPIIDYIEERAI